MAQAVAQGLAWTAAVAARVSWAAVEGFVFAWSRRSAALVAAAELAAFAAMCGVRKPLGIAIGTLVAAGTLRTAQCLFLSFRDTGLRPQALEQLSSVWDWEPPTEDAGASSAWHVLRQLAQTTNRLRAENPAIAALLDQPQLAANELAMRFFYFYMSDDEPLLDAATVATLQRGGGGGGSGSSSSSEDGQGGSGGDGGGAVGDCCGVAPVPAELHQQLAHYRPYACLSYDFNTDEALGSQLAERGFTLLAASHAADIKEACPAYFLAMSEARQEVMLAVRGTWSPEDAFFDLLATGEVFDAASEGGSLAAPAGAEPLEPCAARLSGSVHSGMGRGALYLGAKFGPLLRPLYAQGWRVTLVGHSLGAGVASLLAVYLRNRGLGADRLACWAYETPACMDVHLAEACSDVVTSLVNCDDVVPRLSIRAFAELLQELSGFDWRAAAAARAAAHGGDGSGLQLQQHLEGLLHSMLGGRVDDGGGGGGAKGGGGDGSSGDAAAAAEDALHAAAAAAGEAGLQRLGSAGFERSYNAHVPGRVVLVYRPAGASDSAEEAGDEDAAAGAAAGLRDGMALVPSTHRAVRRLRVSPRMVTDHFIDRPEVMAALGEAD